MPDDATRVGRLRPHPSRCFDEDSGSHAERTHILYNVCTLQFYTLHTHVVGGEMIICTTGSLELPSGTRHERLQVRGERRLHFAERPRRHRVALSYQLDVIQAAIAVTSPAAGRV